MNFTFKIKTLNKKLITSLLLITIGLSFTPVMAKNWTGALAPNFKLQDQNNKWHQLSDYKGQWLVLYFYPKDETPGCTTEAKNFRDAQKQMTNLKVNVVGVSIDSIASHKSFASVHKLNFSLLSDESMEVSKTYDVLQSIGPLHYAKRQTFIIDPDGEIVKHYEKVNASKHAEQLVHDLPLLKKNYSK